MKYQLPRIIGHRGAMRQAPENTLTGIDQAAREGAIWVEMDVKLTRDGVPILMHDQNLKRTTGLKALVRDTDYRDIRKLDAGQRFDVDFAGEPVPSLQEALARCALLGLTPNIEIKPCPGQERATALAVTEAIKAYWPKGETPPLLSSFATKSLIAARRDAPAYPRGLLANRMPRDWQRLASRLELTALHLNGTHITARQLAACREARLPVIAWTINHPRLAASLMAAGVQSIITDCPATLRAALAELPPGLQKLRHDWAFEMPESGWPDWLRLPEPESPSPPIYGRLTRFAMNAWA